MQVDGADVGDAFVTVVDVVQAMVLLQVLVQGFGLLLELFLAVAVGDHLGHGIKHIVKDGGVPLGFRFGTGGRAAAGQQAERPGQQQADKTLAFHTLPPFWAAAKAVCSSCRWASRSPNIQFRLEGVTTALRGMRTWA